jgi:hypothetical protein
MMAALTTVFVFLKMALAPAKLAAAGLSATKFIGEHWKELILGSMIVLIIYQNFMTVEVAKWVGIRTIPGITAEYEKKLDNKERKLKECRSLTDRLVDEINFTNAQIDKWADVSIQLQQQHDQLMDELGEMRRQTEQTVLDILEGPVPETCELAIESLRDATKGELKW